MNYNNSHLYTSMMQISKSQINWYFIYLFFNLNAINHMIYKDQICI